jgi:hypothetical protein
VEDAKSAIPLLVDEAAQGANEEVESMQDKRL